MVWLILSVTLPNQSVNVIAGMTSSSTGTTFITFLTGAVAVVTRPGIPGLRPTLTRLAGDVKMVVAAPVVDALSCRVKRALLAYATCMRWG